MNFAETKIALPAPASAAEKADRIAFLDFLRIFAFLSVLIGHKYYDKLTALVDDQSVHATLRAIGAFSAPFFEGGGAGVVVFFLVSGYIVSHVLQAESVPEFLVKRVARIYPLYIFAALVQIALLWASGVRLPFSVYAQQLLLVGDLFATPYSLNGVEWTLRIEALFYLIMAALAYSRLMSTYWSALPYVFFLIVIACAVLAPIPGADGWSKGYLTIYMPFLFIGAMFYLLEKRVVGPALCAIFVAFVFLQYFTLIALYQQRWLHANFAALAFLLFFAAWLWRHHFKLESWSLTLSSMTYAVYLFHAWLLDDLRRWISQLTGNQKAIELFALIGVFLASYLAMKYIERPGIAIGRKASRRLLKLLEGQKSVVGVSAWPAPADDALRSLRSWLASRTGSR